MNPYLDKEFAKVALGGTIDSDGNLFKDSREWYLNWNVGEGRATLEGRFTASDLRLISYWMEYGSHD